jgi:hypothetical protein
VVTGSARRIVLLVGVVVAAEAVALLVLAGLDLRDTDADRLGSGVGVAVLLAAYAVAQVVAVWFLLAGHAVARSPLVVTQVLQVLVATSLRDQPASALAVAVPALVVLGCLLAPPVTRALASPER